MSVSRSQCDVLARSLQQVLLAGFGIRNLVDHQAHTALGNVIGGTISELERHNGLGCREAEHREQVHNWVGASAGHCHHLRLANLGSSYWVRIAGSHSRKTDKELVNDVHEFELLMGCLLVEVRIIYEIC